MLLYIDINDSCHLKCRTCPRGVRAFPNTAKKMSLAMFERVVRKGLHDGAYQVGLFNWVEPFLVKNLFEYTQIVKHVGLRCEIASTLSQGKIENLIECLKSVDMLWVTMSGATQEIYEINHVGGKVDNVYRHLREIKAARQAGEISTDILVRYLRYDYNEHEEEGLRESVLADGFRFEVILGSGHPQRMPASANREQEIASALSQFSSSRIYEPTGSVCPLLFEHIAVNADGDVYQCSAHGYHAPLRIGAYLDLSREEILLRRYNQPYCNSCDWKRRRATEPEKALLVQAVEARLGATVVDRIGPLSRPDTVIGVTDDGAFLPKDGHAPW